MCNNKENAMNKVIDIVVDCCATDLGNGKKSLTREDVLGKRKDENICMARTILVNQLLWAGFTVSTVSSLLHRTPQAKGELTLRTSPSQPPFPQLDMQAPE